MAASSSKNGYYRPTSSLANQLNQDLHSKTDSGCFLLNVLVSIRNYMDKIIKEISKGFCGITITTTTTEIPETTNCQSDFILLGSQCYFFSNSKSNWRNALEACQDKNSDLAHPKNAEQNSQLFNHLKDNFEGSDELFKDDSDKSWLQMVLVFAKDEANNAIVNLLPNSFPTTKHSYCQPGFIQLNSDCYFFSITSQTWQEAEKSCQSKNASLAHPTNRNQDIQLIMYLIKTYDYTRNFWLGATDAGVEGKWIWISNNSSMIYKDWNPGEPSNTNNNENCLEATAWSNWRWNDAWCLKKQPYICQNSMNDH
ncbi:Fc fragment of IgE, low affinity II, receptor for (CD23) [Chamberlinius hualienensis]